MKSLELTEEHKSKLLEMCKILFPKYIFRFTNDLADEVIMECHQGEWKDVIFFHWFEFCMTYLMLKFYWNDYEKCKDFLMRCLFKCEQPHPVDYLYKEFKKLK